jgi:hypothetical protein
MNRPMVEVLRFASILSAKARILDFAAGKSRWVITKEKEDSPVPLDLLFEKGEKAIVSDVADVAK